MIIRQLIIQTSKKYPILTLCTILSILVSSVLYAVSPLILGKIFLNFNLSEPNIIYAVLLYGIISSSSIILSQVARGYIFTPVEEYFVRRLATALFHHITCLEYTFHTHSDSGNTCKTLDRGYERAFAFIKYAIFSVAVSILDILLISIVIYTMYGIALAFVLITFSITYAVSTIYMSSKRSKIFNMLLKCEGDMSAFVTESLLNNTSIKYFQNEELITQKYEQLFMKYSQTNISILGSLALLNSIQSALFYFATTCLIILLLITNANACQSMIIIEGLRRIYATLYNLGFSFKEMVQSYNSLKAISNMFTEHSAERINGTNINNLKGDIEFQNVTLRYCDKVILDNISFNIHSGQSVAFVGSSGAGKSTLMNLLFGFIESYEGHILIDGLDIRTLTLSSLRTSLSIVPQNITLFNDTLVENVKFGFPNATNEMAISAIKQSGLAHILAYGQEYRIGSNGTKLSGGERQRVGIARIILRNTQIVIFDEATSALDNKLEKQIQNTFRKISKNKTRISIAHRLSTITDSNIIFLLENGKIIEQGSHSELLQLNGKYSELWNIQSANNESI